MADSLTQPVAERIISSLEDGVPSVEDIQYFSSTSNPLDPTIRSDLDKISSGAFGKIKFLNGSYGEGKSHFLSRVRRKAIDENFLVSMFEISPRGVSLDMMERTFSEIIKNLTTKGFAWDSAETIIEYVLSKWFPTVENFEQELRKMPLDKDLKAALIEITKRLDQRDSYYEDLDSLDRWLKAETQSIGDMRKKFKIYNHINPRNVFDILKSLGKFFKLIGYKGLVILVDEQEIVSTLLTTRKRKLTDQNIRILIDDQGKMDGIYILFATTDEFFTDDIKGVVSYPALKTRITKANTLDLPPIKKKEMEEIAANIKEICQVAWGIPLRIEKSQLNNCVAIALEHNIPSARARTYVKAVIRLMQHLHDGKTEDPVSIFSELYGSTFSEVATEREQSQPGS